MHSSYQVVKWAIKAKLSIIQGLEVLVLATLLLSSQRKQWEILF